VKKRFSAAVTIILLLGAICCADRLRSQAMGHYLGTRRYENVYYLPPPAWLRLFSLGYREALADLIWMKALVYFGEELYHRGDVTHLYAYTDAMLALDERFVAVYRWVASCALYRTGEITADDARKAISYLERAIRLFPDDGELAWDLGATYRFELVPLLEDRKKRDEARRRGVEYLQAAALRGAGPSWLVLTNATQLEKLGHTEQAIHHLEEAYGTIHDPQIRESIEIRLRELRSVAHAEALKHAVVSFEQKRQRDFPYLSGTLYWLVGPRPPFDGYRQLLHHFDPLSDRLGDEDEQK
jgi:tetratricopeptide (TPR) repeat protein